MSLLDCNLQQLQLLCEHAPWYATHTRVDFQSGCWIYTGKLNRNGYGRINWRYPINHRMVYEFFLGLKGEKELPKHLVLDHGCRCRACFNPAHLEPVTVKVNTLRGRAILFSKKENGNVNQASQ